MEQDTPQPRRHWWRDPWTWVGFVTGWVIVWAYKTGYRLGRAERDD
jgi:hypothetical protein